MVVYYTFAEGILDLSHPEVLNGCRPRLEDSLGHSSNPESLGLRNMGHRRNLICHQVDETDTVKRSEVTQIEVRSAAMAVGYHDGSVRLFDTETGDSEVS